VDGRCLSDRKKRPGILWSDGIVKGIREGHMNDKREEILPQHSVCPGGIKIPTEEELKALSEMRRIKGKVRSLKERLKGLEGSGSSEDIQSVKDDLAVLKNEWNQWEKRRKVAARERMMLLGHE
jgi:predicted nuclease with TOPRIM domain